MRWWGRGWSSWRTNRSGPTRADSASTRPVWPGPATSGRTRAWPTVSVPCLILAFEHDVDSPPARAREAAALIPGARFVEIPEASHLGIFTHSTQVGAALVEFFAGSERRRPRLRSRGLSGPRPARTGRWSSARGTAPSRGDRSAGPGRPPPALWRMSPWRGHPVVGGVGPRLCSGEVQGEPGVQGRPWSGRRRRGVQPEHAAGEGHGMAVGVAGGRPSLARGRAGRNEVGARSDSGWSR